MKITVICVGKTSTPYLKEGIRQYQERLVHYTKLDWIELIDVPVKGHSTGQLKEKEGQLILKNIKSDDTVVLLDDKGSNPSSEEMAQWMQKKMNASVKNLVLIIGGAFGFSDEVYKRSESLLSFSRMTFSHEMIRLFLAEQLYRSFTILKGERYHHP